MITLNDDHEPIGRELGPLGLMWVDDREIALTIKIRDAVAAYAKRFGRPATRVTLAVEDAGDVDDLRQLLEDVGLGAVQVVLDEHALPRHILVT